MKEKIDIVNEKNELTGEIIYKNIAHKKGLWHRSIHVWIYNSKKEILIQKRAKIKDYFPGVWDLSVGGHVSSGEETIISAMREVGEEVGINIGKDELKFLLIHKEQTIAGEIINNEFVYVYLLKWDGDIKKLKLQDEEVEQIKFISIDDLEKKIRYNKNNFIPHGEYWNKMFKIIKELQTKKS